MELRRLIVLSLIIIVLNNFVCFSQTSSILPVPQYMKFGMGTLKLKNLSISFPESSSDSDLFAANELIIQIRKEFSTEIYLSDELNKDHGIVFQKVDDSFTFGRDEIPAIKSSNEIYSIKVSDDLVLIKAKSSTGFFYAVQTLKQLLRKEKGEVVLPIVEIVDWPTMKYRGFLMDMTHLHFPTVAEIKEQLDFLALWKTNQYYFYSELNIELEEFPLIMPRARFKKEEISEIIDYAKERHIDVIPHVNLYGHLHDLFKYEHYADLAVTPYGRDFTSINPRVDTILSQWINSYTNMFTSEFFHIGFDETMRIEKEAKILGVPTDQLYLRMLNKVVDKVRPKNKRILIYGDMLQKYNSIIKDVPKDVTVVAWHYIPYLNEKYKELLEPFKANDLPLFIQSATYNYMWLYPNTSISFANHRKLIEQGEIYGASGFVNSGWTDDTQVLMRSSRPDMAYGSSIAWHNVMKSDSLFWDDYTKILYPDSVASLIKSAHLELNRAADITKRVFKYSSFALWENPFTKKSMENTEKNIALIKNARFHSEKAQISLIRAMKLGRDSVSIQAMLAAAKQIDLLAMKHLYSAHIAQLLKRHQINRDQKVFKEELGEVIAYYSSLTFDMFDAIVETKELFKKAWLNEYTDYRLEIALSKFDRELDFWVKVQAELKTLIELEEDKELPTTEELFD